MATINRELSQATFGELLRRWRRSKRLSQCDLGALLVPTVHHSTISAWEIESRVPSRRYLTQIVVLTGIPAHLALGVPDHEEANP